MCLLQHDFSSGQAVGTLLTYTVYIHTIFVSGMPQQSPHSVFQTKLSCFSSFNLGLTHFLHGLLCVWHLLIESFIPEYSVLARTFGMVTDIRIGTHGIFIVLHILHLSDVIYLVKSHYKQATPKQVLRFMQCENSRDFNGPLPDWGSLTAPLFTYAFRRLSWTDPNNFKTDTVCLLSPHPSSILNLS